MMVAYMDGATSEIDNTLDGRYINDNETALTSSLKGEEFVIKPKDYHLILVTLFN
jgi:hypothetical protein